MNTMMESVMKLHRCEDCPVRCQAVKKPRSIYARIHRWHTTWWPGWRIYQAELRERMLRDSKMNAAGATASD